MSSALQPGRPLAKRRALERFLGGRTSAWRGCDDGAVDTCTHLRARVVTAPVLVTAACAARARARRPPIRRAFRLRGIGFVGSFAPRGARFRRGSPARFAAPRRRGFGGIFGTGAHPRPRADLRKAKRGAADETHADGPARARGKGRGQKAPRPPRPERSACEVMATGGAPPRDRATTAHLQPKPTPLIKTSMFPVGICNDFIKDSSEAARARGALRCQVKVRPVSSGVMRERCARRV